MKKTDQHFTYADYRTWPDDERWELIDGIAWDMSQAPSRNHQLVVGRFHQRLANHLEGKPCAVFVAPYDVFFPANPEQSDDDVDTIVQPDLTVICSSEKDQDKGCWGPPDLVVEVLSPSTSHKDQRDKFDLYERSGVREYWVVDPVGRYVRIYTLGQDQSYGSGDVIDGDDVADSRILKGFSLAMSDLFADVRVG